MSIQFRCESCGQSLKVPAGSAGKKVRCPQCEEINVIPDSEETGPFATPPPSSEFPPSSADPQNPFATPTSAPDAPPVYTGELSYDKIDMRDVFEQAWRRYKPNLWISALFGLIFFGIGFGSGLIGQLTQMAAQLSGDEIIIAVVFFVVFVVQQFISAYQQCMGKRFGLNVVRGSSEVMNGIFSFDKVVNVFLFFVLVGVAFFVAFLIVAIPAGIAAVLAQNGGGLAGIGFGISVLLGLIAAVVGIVFMFRVFLTMFFIIDRDLGVVDAMKQSNVFMTGNSLVTFVTMFVAGIGMALFSLVTCGIGFFFAFPLLETMQAVIYTKATGQYQNI